MTTTTSYLAQQAPTSLSATYSASLFFDCVFWICIAEVVIGAIIAVTGIVRSRWGRQSDEVTSNMLRVGIGTAALGGMGTLLSWMIIR